MKLPQKLQAAIERVTAGFNFHDIVTAREELTNRYRQHQSKKQSFMTTHAERCAYLVARLPATYAVIYKVLEEVRSFLTDTSTDGSKITTLLDLGAGPGSVTWAASELFSEFEKITLVERDRELVKIGKDLASQHTLTAVQNARWELQDLEQLSISEQYNLIVLSYSIGELRLAAIPPLIEACWNLTNNFLVIIEPGTPKGFERMRTIRNQLISLGGHLRAPCSHAFTCPMSGGDWCHFSERIERSSLHRRIKNGALGYEDEKFSYLIFSKLPCSLPQARGRLLRHPSKHSGHVNLTLCTDQGIKQEVVSKRNPEAYKKARKTEWGSKWMD